MSSISLTLAVRVRYKPNGVPAHVLATMLKEIPRRAAADGLFTQSTAAEVDEWDVEVALDPVQE